MEFEWDPAKAVSNRRKHGVSFDEAQSVFDDPRVLVRYDAAHSNEEDRRNALGLSSEMRVLAVTYTIRGMAIRVISARKAARAEVEEYDQS